MIINLLDKISKVLKNSEKVTNENDKERYISPRERQKTIDNLRLIIIV